MVARIIEYSRSMNGNPRVTLEVESLDEFRGFEGDFNLEISKKAEHRSKAANSYFHKLVGLIADKMSPPISKARCKNIMLARYGQRELTEDGPMIISIISKVDMLEREDIHCTPVGYGEANGREFTHWAIIKPSHEYDSREMARLIDGTVEEAKQLGIETKSPQEIERLKELWTQYYSRKRSASSADPESD